jgi:hypothetical protein
VKKYTERILEEKSEDGTLDEAIHAYIKKNLRIRVETGSYDIRVILMLGEEEIGADGDELNFQRIHNPDES